MDLRAYFSRSQPNDALATHYGFCLPLLLSEIACGQAYLFCSTVSERDETCLSTTKISACFFFFWFVNDKSLTVYITFALFVFHCVNWLARYMTALGDLMAEWLGMADWVGMAGWLTDWLTG